ncbi:MAG: sensory rhodopsin transducer [Defluviitaleaceae bacterium]|nr:sensory rhodopsin transducer [Defluviitaleaceae bacterium]
MKKAGKKLWFIADAYYDSQSNHQPSHESVCVLNTSEVNAVITMTLYFEDRPKMKGFVSHCKAGRTHHIRMDKIKSKSGEPVPQDTPYAIVVESDVPVVVQYTRLDTAQAEMALMTTMGYSE